VLGFNNMAFSFKKWGTPHPAGKLCSLLVDDRCLLQAKRMGDLISKMVQPS
jgi:hypothetical protein